MSDELGKDKDHERLEERITEDADTRVWVAGTSLLVDSVPVDQIEHSSRSVSLDDLKNAAQLLLSEIQKRTTFETDKILPQRADTKTDTAKGQGAQPMPEPSDSYSRTEIDAKLQTSEARIETQLATMRGEMREGFATIRGDVRALVTDAVTQIKAEQRTSRLTIIGTVVASAIGAAAIVIGIAGVLYAGALADRANILAGVQTGAAVRQEATPTQPGK